MRFDLDPSIVRSLVEKQQIAYLQGLNGAQFRTRSGALNAIQGYTALCLPPSIETEVGRAVEASQYRAVDYFGKNAPPAAGAAPGPADSTDDEMPLPSPSPPESDSTPILCRSPGG